MGILYEKDQGGAATKYVRANGMLIAKITVSGAIHHYLGGHLGSTQQVRDSARDLVFSASYEPFGTPYDVTGSMTNSGVLGRKACPGSEKARRSAVRPRMTARRAW